MEVVRKFGGYISKEKQHELKMTIPGKEPANSKGVCINISKIYDQCYNEQYAKIYEKVDVAQPNDGTEPHDELGYLGKTKWQREIVKTSPIKEVDFLEIITKTNHL
jgi:hypothetical protein